MSVYECWSACVCVWARCGSVKGRRRSCATRSLNFRQDSRRKKSWVVSLWAATITRGRVPRAGVGQRRSVSIGWWWKGDVVVCVGVLMIVCACFSVSSIIYLLIYCLISFLLVVSFLFAPLLPPLFCFIVFIFLLIFYFSCAVGLFSSLFFALYRLISPSYFFPSSFTSISSLSTNKYHINSCNVVLCPSPLSHGFRGLLPVIVFFIPNIWITCSFLYCPNLVVSFFH